MCLGGRAHCSGCVKAKPLLWRLACHLTHFASKANTRQCKTKDVPHRTVQSGGRLALGSVIRHRELVGSDVEFIAEVDLRQTALLRPLARKRLQQLRERHLGPLLRVQDALDDVGRKQREP